MHDDFCFSYSAHSHLTFCKGSKCILGLFFFFIKLSLMCRQCFDLHFVFVSIHLHTTSHVTKLLIVILFMEQSDV